MNKTTHNSSIRLMFLMIYLAVSFPMHIRMLMRFINEQQNLLKAGILPLVFILYIFIECYEYYKWNYHYDDYRIPRILFIIRVLIIFVPVFLLEGEGRMFTIFTFTSPLVFYAYYIFSIRYSMLFVIAVSTTVSTYDFIYNPNISLSNQTVFMILYRFLIYILFYSLAWFLDRDRKQTLENENLLEQLREYASKAAQSAVMEERTRLARDLHDTLGHSLTAIQIQLSKAEAYIQEDLNEAVNAVKAAKVTAKDAMYDVRASLNSLNSNDAQIHLKDSIEKLLEGVKGAGVNVNFTLTGVEKGYNYAVLMTLYRIVQEGLTNVLKYANAHSVELSINLGDEECTLILEDDGCGFRVEDLAKTDESSHFSESHYGIPGLYRRLELVRGIMEVDSAPGKGVRLKASLPKDPVLLIGDKQ